MKLSSWPEIGSDGDVLLTPYVPKGVAGYDDDDDEVFIGSSEMPLREMARPVILAVAINVHKPFSLMAVK